MKKPLKKPQNKKINGKKPDIMIHNTLHNYMLHFFKIKYNNGIRNKHLGIYKLTI